MNRIKGKTALITGASSGIGKAIANELAVYGCNLILTGRRHKRLLEISNSLAKQYGIEIQIASFDIRDLDACKKFASEYSSKRIDILINNAGLAKGIDPVQNGDFEDWDTMIDTNVKGVLAMTRLFLPTMIKNNHGHIINIGSTAGHESYSGGVIYCATKHAVKAITEATKKDVHGTNIRVGMVSPGLVETEFSVVRFSGDIHRANSVYNGMEPLTATDIAEIVVFMVNRPQHVNILDSIVMPVAQSSAQMVYRNEE